MPKPRMRVSLEGGELLAKRLRVLPDAVQGRKLDQATAAGAEVLREFQQALAPRGDDGPPHAFQFIHANRVREVASPTKSQYDVGPGGAGFYLTFHETGTLYLAPQPFMRPAIEAGEGDILDAVRDRLLRELKLAARRR